MNAGTLRRREMSTSVATKTAVADDRNGQRETEGDDAKRQRDQGDQGQRREVCEAGDHRRGRGFGSGQAVTSRQVGARDLAGLEGQQVVEEKAGLEDGEEATHWLRRREQRPPGNGSQPERQRIARRHREDDAGAAQHGVPGGAQLPEVEPEQHVGGEGKDDSQTGNRLPCMEALARWRDGYDTGSKGHEARSDLPYGKN